MWGKLQPAVGRTLVVDPHVSDIVQDPERQGPCHAGAFVQAERELTDDEARDAQSVLWAFRGQCGQWGQGSWELTEGDQAGP